MYCKVCGKPVGEDANFCQSCGKEIKYESHHTNQRPETTDARRALVKYNKRGNAKIGGWLYAICLIIFIKLILSFLSFIAYIPVTFINGTYIKHIFPLYEIEFVFIGVYILYNFFVIKLFFTNNKSFIKHCMSFLFLPIIFTVIEIFTLYIVCKDIDKICIVISELIKPMFIYSLFCSVVGVYLNQSKRVEQTFTK